MNYSIDIRLPAEFLVLADQYLRERKDQLPVVPEFRPYCTLVSGEYGSQDEELLRQALRSIHQPPFEVSLEQRLRLWDGNSLVVQLQPQEDLLELQSTIIEVIEGYPTIKLRLWYHPHILLGHRRREVFKPGLVQLFERCSWMANEFLLSRNNVGLELVEVFPLSHSS